MFRYLYLIAASIWLTTFSITPQHASAYVSDEANIQVADYILSSNSNVRNYFMNMDIDSYSSCAATTIAFTAWEIRGDVNLDENSQILWALMLKGTTLARDNMIVSGYPIDTIDDMLKYKGDMVMMGGSAQDQVIQGCQYHVMQILSLIQ
jgi:3-polyprenyl-4-hydroxybenzoate decarboxylase